jgi:hypothetical protein
MAFVVGGIRCAIPPYALGIFGIGEVPALF